jgi:endo-1,4-beta-xylanase
MSAKSFFVLTIFAILTSTVLSASLAACRQVPEVGSPSLRVSPSSSPTPALSEAEGPTNTPKPTETPTPTVIETPSVPMIEVNGLKIPDPKVSNPELFDLTKHLTKNNSPIVQFANAFGVNPEEVGNLTPQLLTGIDGKQLVVLTTGDLAATANFDESGIPLLIYTNENQWRSISEKDLSPLNMTIGAAINIWTGDFNDSRYKSTFLKNYNLGATDGVFDQGTLFRNIKVQEGQRLTPQQVVDQYYWKDYEEIAKFLKTNNVPMRIHYIFPEYIDKQTVPDWMQKFSDDELRTWMQMHTKAILEKYSSNEIVVVNEAMWMDNKGWAGFPNNNYLFERLGIDYVKMAFDFAHSIQPNATLIINQDTQVNGIQTNIIDNDLMKYLFNFVQQQVAQGVPIGGVGLQGHYLARDFVSQNTDQSIAKFKQELINLMKQYKTINVPAYITELDVNMGGLPSDWTQVQREDLKAKIYSAVYEAAIESENCRSVTTWGFTNTSSWVIQGQYPYPPADSPLPYDDYYKPTISYYAILQSLLEEQMK